MLTSIFVKLLNMSITASFIIAFVLLVRVILHKKMPKLFTYALWGIVLLRLLVPFSISSNLSMFNLINRPTPPNTVSIQDMPFDINLTPTQQDIDMETITTDLSIQSIQPNLIKPMEIWLTIGATVWAVVVGFLLLCYLLSYLIMVRRLATATRYKDNIYLSEQVKGPIVFGFIKPKIILPFNIENICTKQEIAHIIAHEKVHIRRFDHITKPLSFFVSMVYCFNPLVWLAFVLSNKDRELSCDEQVMKLSQGDIRAEYANSLLHIGTQRNNPFGALAFGESNIKSRIKSIIGFQKPATWIAVISIVLLLTISIVCLTDANAIQADETIQPPVFPINQNNDSINDVIEPSTPVTNESVEEISEISQTLAPQTEENTSQTNGVTPKPIPTEENANHANDVTQTPVPPTNQTSIVTPTPVPPADQTSIVTPTPTPNPNVNQIDGIPKTFNSANQTFNKTIRNIVITENEKIFPGAEFQAEAHKIFEIQEDNTDSAFVKVYACITYYNYAPFDGGFGENGARIYIPAVIKLSKQGNLYKYSQLPYGVDANNFIKSNFPPNLDQSAMYSDKSHYLAMEDEIQAQLRDYLISTGRI